MTVLLPMLCGCSQSQQKIQKSVVKGDSSSMPIVRPSGIKMQFADFDGQKFGTLWYDDTWRKYVYCIEPEFELSGVTESGAFENVIVIGCDGETHWIGLASECAEKPSSANFTLVAECLPSEVASHRFTEEQSAYLGGHVGIQSMIDRICVVEKNLEELKVNEHRGKLGSKLIIDAVTKADGATILDSPRENEVLHRVFNNEKENKFVEIVGEGEDRYYFLLELDDSPSCFSRVEVALRLL